MCIHYRQLNKMSIKNSYPLSRMDDFFDQLQEPSYLSNIDRQSGYHNVKVNMMIF